MARTHVKVCKGFFKLNRGGVTLKGISEQISNIDKKIDNFVKIEPQPKINYPRKSFKLLKQLNDKIINLEQKILDVASRQPPPPPPVGDIGIPPPPPPPPQLSMKHKEGVKKQQEQGFIAPSQQQLTDMIAKLRKKTAQGGKIDKIYHFRHLYL